MRRTSALEEHNFLDATDRFGCPKRIVESRCRWSGVLHVRVGSGYGRSAIRLIVIDEHQPGSRCRDGGVRGHCGFTIGGDRMSGIDLCIDQAGLLPSRLVEYSEVALAVDGPQRTVDPDNAL